jgi:hypothetical protein
MTDEELLTLVGQYERAALGSATSAGTIVQGTQYPNGEQMTSLEVDRFNALNMYAARPMGNEVENRSQVVIPELRDTVEWIMPQMMRIFVGSKQTCRFDPRGPDDIEQAQTETDAVNHVFMKQNNGFFVLHDFIKDALLLRNGYSKTFTETKTESKVETYTGVLETELPRILQAANGEEIEVLGQHEYTITAPAPIMPMLPPGAPPMAAPPPMTAQCFDIKIRRKSTRKVTRVMCVPPEEMRVHSEATGSLGDVPFAGHMTTKTRSELIVEGFDKAIVNKVSPGKMNFLEMDSLARNVVTDQLAMDSASDFSMQEVEFRHYAVRVDYDGDGVAELREVKIAGDTILENEEIDETPFSSCSPIRMPHRHTGISYYDLIGDLQVIKTMLFRQGLDNLYLANNSRVAVDWQNVNIDDLLTSRPGGVVRTKGNPAESIMPMVTPSNIVDQVIPALQYADSLREMRTGVGRDTMGLDADALQDVTKGGQLAAMSAASLKIELVARLIAEGVKEMFSKIHGELMRNQDQPLMFEIAKKWVTTDPTSWRKRDMMTVNVGLGAGNQEQGKQNIAMVQGMQEKIAPLGLVGPKQAYNAFKIGVELLGYENAGDFAMDPSSPEYQQHMAEMQQHQMNAPPAPQVAVAKIKAQSDQAIAQGQAQRDVLKLQGQLAVAQANLAAANARSQQELAHAAQEGQRERAHDALIEQHSRTHEAVQGNVERQADAQAMHADMAQTLIKVIGSIVASQLKQNAQADAGQVVKRDYQELQDL